MAHEALVISRRALLGGAACAGDGPAEARSLDELADRVGLGPLG